MKTAHGKFHVLKGLVYAQDYDVTDIQCTFSSGGTGRDAVTALLRKPDGFRGAPLFADDRTTDPIADPVCQIRPEPDDPTGLLYRLRISDFTKCGVLKRNGFVHVRIWFPQFPGVVMQSDQELIIMCKPPEPTIIENKAAGFAGSFPHGARVSGVVEETPGSADWHKVAIACSDQPGLCLEAYQAARGHGRRKRELSEEYDFQNITSSPLIADNGSTPFTRFKENLEYTVVMPGELFHKTPIEATCGTSMMVAVVLGMLLFMSALLMCYLASRLNSTMMKSNLHVPNGKGFEQILRELANHSIPDTGYTGRPTVQ
ncbi:unnamed protein product [Leptidea sinapis]|uniref:ZP domain-containing protein n=1 Tax=Leptidea sinapis TaxID=189913 RepID=A0A5E4QZP7_9NEOP|nr:unnamed protein product [Leptidea sinapis]